MIPIALGLVVGVVIGLLYLFAKDRAVQRTLASSILLGVVVGILVELARRPIFTAVFAGVATIVLVEFIRWVMAGRTRRDKE
ncbi:MAG: hypothetical protein A2105_02360 [Omnitrophica WOR_2 bacterium GWF2_63_9]|nr:MAG: hypothetical protein A2105_02360 [Omnitrophica WOR_2 bacterium GWF2_63_9]